MSLRPSTPKHFWIVPILVLGLSTILTLPMSHSALAQATAPAATAEPAKPGAVSKVKEKSKETWADMKTRWAIQKDRWADCQAREKAEKRGRTASRAFLEDCMKQ